MEQKQKQRQVESRSAASSVAATGRRGRCIASRTAVDAGAGARRTRSAVLSSSSLIAADTVKSVMHRARWLTFFLHYINAYNSCRSNLGEGVNPAQAVGYSIFSSAQLIVVRCCADMD